jgi:dihydrofolate synthase/folylpolyglutamate synthase
MTYFQRKKCDIVVLEVGMGGEFDSTNVIETPEIAVITSIGYDHVKELGPTIRDIALAKAGIIKKGGDIIIYGGDPKKVTYMETAVSETVEIDAADVFERISAERGARLHWVDFSRITRQQFSLEGLRFDFMPYGEIILPLVGAYQLKNAAAAITALELLREKRYSISNGDIVDGLAAVKWPGRFEVLGHDPVFILDGAHNPQGIKATADSLRCHFGEQKVIFIVGVMADKDVDSMIDIIAPLAESFIAVRPNNPRALGARELCRRISRYGIPATAYDTIKSGVAAAIDMAKAKMGAEVKTREGARTGAGEKTGAGLGPGKDSIICALGSLYLSEDTRAAFNVMEN